MSLMGRATKAAKRFAKNIFGGSSGGTMTHYLPALTLPSRTLPLKPRHLPIWTGTVRSAYVTSDSTPDSGSRSKQQRRARDRQMRAGLPSMSGRQWRRIRKAMYRKAKAITIQQRQEVGR